MNTKIKFFILSFVAGIIFSQVFLFTFAEASPQSTFNFQVFSQTECVDGIDNDSNGMIDYPADGGCESMLDNSEKTIFTSNSTGSGEGQIINVIIPPSIGGEGAFVEVGPSSRKETFIERVFNNIRNQFNGSASGDPEEKNEELAEEAVSPEVNNNTSPRSAALSPSEPGETSEVGVVVTIVVALVSAVLIVFRLALNIFGQLI